MRKTIILTASIALITIILTATYFIFSRTSTHGAVKIFCAGSLKKSLERIAEVFEDRYGVEVHIEASGSVEAVRKIIDLKKTCDIIAVADYRLLREYMYPKYIDWYVAFAGNELVLALTDKSKYADEIIKDPGKWYEILMRGDVRWGFSDPNKDPCGYRAVGVLALASIYYNRSDILDKLVASKLNVEIRVSNGRIDIYVPPSIQVKDPNLVIRPKSVDLVSLLKAGSIDYAFEYRSVAMQHNLKFIELPREINLSDPSYDEFYSRVTVHILIGTEREKAITMKSIVYGVAVLKNAPNKDLALSFVKLLLGSDGKRIFEELGQPFLKKFLYYGSVPEELKVEAP